MTIFNEIATPDSLNQRYVAFCETMSGFFPAVSAAIAGVVFVAWTFNIKFLERMVPGYPRMNPTTAVGIILLAAALFLKRDEAAGRHRRLVSNIFSFIASAVGITVILGHILNWNFHIDGFLFSSRLSGSGISTHTALSFIFPRP